MAKVVCFLLFYYFDQKVLKYSSGSHSDALFKKKKKSERFMHLVELMDVRYADANGQT